MSTTLKYRLLSLVLLLGIVICAGGIYWKLAWALDDPPSGPGHENGELLGLGEWVYFQSGDSKQYVGSYIGTYVVSTGGCKHLWYYDAGAEEFHGETDPSVHWRCDQTATQNGWGILYNATTSASMPGELIVNVTRALIPTSNVAGDNTYLKAHIKDSQSLLGHEWASDGNTSPGKIGVELILYDPQSVNPFYVDL